MKNKKYTSASLTKRNDDNGVKMLMQVNFTRKENNGILYSFMSFVSFGGLRLYKHSHYYCYSGTDRVFYRKLSLMTSLLLYWLWIRTKITIKYYAVRFYLPIKVKSIIMRMYNMPVRYIEYKTALKNWKESQTMFPGLCIKPNISDYLLKY